MGIKIQSSAHWYTKDGETSHDSDLRDARKRLLYTSVTSVDKDMFTNPALDRYKAEQLTKAAFENPRQPHEDIDDYSQRIYLVSLEHAKAAANKGVAIHTAIDGIYEIAPPEIEPFIAGTRKWFNENIVSIVSSEKVVLDHDISVAGRMDKRVIHRKYGLCTLDYKSQGIKTVKGKKNKPGFYDSFARQLAFYAAGEAKSEGSYPKLDTCISLVIDSIDPSAPYENVWTHDEILSAYQDFVIAAWGWHKKRNFWPNRPWDLCEKLSKIR